MRRLLYVVFGFVLTMVGLVGFLYRHSSPMGPVEKVDLGVDVSVERLRAHVEALTSIVPARNRDHPESLRKAADYIRSEWKQMGYTVEEQVYKDDQGREYSNLSTRIGMPEGEALLIGAHYDVCEDQPGADDNASGVAGLLELSRHLRAYSEVLRRPVILVAWTLEEPPSYDTEWMGSLVHAKSLREAGVRLIGMLSLEMIGYYSNQPGSQTFPLPLLKLIYPTTGDFITIVGSTGQLEQATSVKRLMLRYSRIGVEAITAPAFVPGVDYSDHRSYWAMDYPGLMITDTSFYRNANYHLPSDTIETLDFQRMAEVVKGVLGVAIEL